MEEVTRLKETAELDHQYGYVGGANTEVARNGSGDIADVDTLPSGPLLADPVVSNE